MIHKILRPFVNTLAVNDKHYLLNRDNLTRRIQIQLSQKQKTFSQFCFAFLKSIANSKHFQKKDDPHSWCIWGNRGSEKYGYINVSKAVLQRPLREIRWEMCRNFVAILMAAPLKYLLIIL